MGKSNQKKSAKQLILDGIDFHSSNGEATARYTLVGADGKAIKHYNVFCPDVKASYGGVRTARGEMKDRIVADVLGYAKSIAKDEEIVEFGEDKLARAQENLEAARAKLDRGEIKVPEFEEYKKALAAAEDYLDRANKMLANEHRVKEFIEKYWGDRL